MSGDKNGDDNTFGERDPPSAMDVFVLVFGHGENYSVAANVPAAYVLGMLCGAVVQVTKNGGLGLNEINSAVNVAWLAHKEGGK